MTNSIFAQLSETTQTEIAIKVVILDAIEKGHTCKTNLISYMRSEVFSNAVKNYRALMTK